MRHLRKQQTYNPNNPFNTTKHKEFSMLLCQNPVIMYNITHASRDVVS